MPLPASVRRAEEPPAGEEAWPPPGAQARDYLRVARAIDFLVRAFPARPDLAQVAAHAGLSAHHFHRLFRRWAAMTPHDFLQALTFERARAALRDQASVLEAALDSGLSGPSRLHDLFLAREAMTPGVYKAGGAGLEIFWGFHDSPFGACLAMATARGLCGLAFADPGRAAQAAALADMKARWPNAAYLSAPERTGPYAEALFGVREGGGPETISLILIGSGFDLRVWQALLAVPEGARVTYGALARQLGAPGAARAVGSAVGRNPLSYIVPCHRVCRADGGLGGYHWGLIRKRAMLAFESRPDGGQASSGGKILRSRTCPPAPIR